MKGEHKGGKKKDNLGWEIIKLQAQVGESTSRKAKKIVEAERKKEHGTASTSTTEVVEEGQDQDQESVVLSEAAQKLLKLKEQKISQKIYHAKKEIRKAFVKAKAFETQRLVKRLREARKAVEEKENKGEAKEEGDKPVHKKKQDLTQEDVTKFENEIELVKKMDIDSLSEHAFVAKLAKHPILGSHTLMAPYTTKKETTAASGSQEDAATIQIIEARLTNTKTVKEHMSKLWDELENIITGKKANEEKNKKRKGSDDQDELKNKKAKTQNDTKKAERSDNEESEDDEDEEMGDVDLSDISDSEREDDGYDSDGLPLPMGGKSAAGSSSSMASMFIGSLNEGSKKDKKDKKGKKDKNDWVDDKFDEIYGKAKKNRPGQQARRAKAERKYGKEANHIKKAEEEARIRAEKKAARKAKQEKFNAQRDASTANAQRLPNRRTIGAGDGSASVVQPSKPRAKPVPAGPDLNDPTLHPSWIAKQTEKAAMAAALSGAKSNKITFDDSD
ncbi:Bud-site selection protein [Linnemannia elongata]|nr:Bud-site selection protein [Linnemannia elongata]